jgi:hypothetical protein
MRTIADYRQLNDALFHAGLNSGSQFEWEDAPNRLRFYIIDIQKNSDGIVSYKIGVRSLDGPGPQKREFVVKPPSDKKLKGNTGYVFFTVTNTGEPSATDQSLHYQNTCRWLNSDIYRLSVTNEDDGHSAMLLNGLISLEPGETAEVPVYIERSKGSSRRTKVKLTVQSETDPGLQAAHSIIVKIH